jgi:hypothetical protein
MNPGFEQDVDNDGSPDNWSNSNVRRSDTVVHSGHYAMLHTLSHSTHSTSSQAVNRVTAGEVYSFSGWVNIPSTRDRFSFKLQVMWNDANGKRISIRTIKTYNTATDGWSEAMLSLVAPPRTTNARIRMEVTGLKARVYVDDFSFEAGATIAPTATVIPNDHAVSSEPEFSTPKAR